MKIAYLILVSSISFFLVSSPCHAERAYMWTDENGVAHISDEPPPPGVNAKSFSTERDYPQAQAGADEDQPKTEAQPQESGFKSPGVTKQTDSNPTGNIAPDAPKTPKYRDPATLSQEERARLTVLKLYGDRAKQNYDSASSEHDRRHWKKEIEKLEADEKSILEVGGR